MVLKLFIELHVRLQDGDKNKCKRTLKYLQAIAHGIWIVDIQVSSWMLALGLEILKQT